MLAIRALVKNGRALHGGLMVGGGNVVAAGGSCSCGDFGWGGGGAREVWDAGGAREVHTAHWTPVIERRRIARRVRMMKVLRGRGWGM